MYTTYDYVWTYKFLYKRKIKLDNKKKKIEYVRLYIDAQTY